MQSSQFDFGHHDGSAGRLAIRAVQREPEEPAVTRLRESLRIDAAARLRIERRTTELILAVRMGHRDIGQIESLLREYDLSSEEGVVLMMLAEALLRIPDAATRDLLIRDKLGGADFDQHLGKSSSTLVNLSTWALAITGRTIRATEGQQTWQRLMARLGEPVLRGALLYAMALMGEHFVLGRTIEDALVRASDAESRGFRHSYDMLGEAALTARDVDRYFHAYETAIRAIGQSESRGPVAGSGISIKLSALHPRYEPRQRDRVLAELYPRVLALAAASKAQDIGCTIDAEEADRLDLSLDAIGRLIRAPELKGWDGLGVAVQAYAKRALPVVDWLTAEAESAGRRLMVRLVKGAYWDTEIKRAQEQGLDGFPVHTRKAVTDLSYLAAAQRILAAGDRLYGQFATHNAYSVAAVLEFAQGRTDYEFQRLHGMGEALYESIVQPPGAGAIACRIYAPVGEHRDLLAYLVRRLLENGANASFVNQIADPDVPVAALTRDPSEILAMARPDPIPLPVDLYRPERPNSSGVDFGDPRALGILAQSLNNVAGDDHEARPLIDGRARNGVSVREIRNPADRRSVIGVAHEAGPVEIDAAVAAAMRAWRDWDHTPVEIRAACLDRAADRIEADRARFIVLAVREAGKTLPAAIGEVREAVDFLRFYAASARAVLTAAALPGPTGEANSLAFGGRGLFACISPWNFPLSIFIGQVAAALVAGNAVIAKPAEQTPLMAVLAVRYLHESGVPPGALSLLPGDGKIGAALIADPRVVGVAFTGSTEAARAINRTLAGRDGPLATLIAETGGINTMIVDSSALIEQAVGDILTSAFDSAGQRCSALRCLYVQAEIADSLTATLTGAIDELRVGDPAVLATDIGPLIDDDALAALQTHAAKIGQSFATAKLVNPETEYGTFFAPRAIWIDGIAALSNEVFGPILHVVRYRADRLDQVLEAIGGTGFGLTLGLQTRIDETVERVRRAARVGNLYVNRSMIGAVVGTQPFGGEGLSGTGPKAGGPNYVRRFANERTLTINTTAAGGNAPLLMSAEDGI